MKDICRGQWQLVVISPELLLSKWFINGVIRNREMIPRILAVVVDEAHVVLHWGSNFRKAYGELGILRTLLPRNTPFVAMSATMPSRVRRDILTKLHLNDEELISLDLGNNRLNVSVVVRPIHNPMNTYSDLAFVIPRDLENLRDIKKTFIYVDSIDDGLAIRQYLRKCLPKELQMLGVIHPYSAAYSATHRTRVMRLFKAGIVHVLVCTDAAEMGCNIPDIDLVIQWKLPASVSAFVQRAGRAARSPEFSGTAILLAERTVYKSSLEEVGKEEAGKGGQVTAKRGVRQSTTYPKASNDYALQHGIQRGTYDGRFDSDELSAGVPIDFNSIDEGLYSLVQATTSKRAGAPVLEVMAELHKWRKAMWDKNHSKASWGPALILTDKQIDMLARAGFIERLKNLEEVVGEDWRWLGKYGDALLEKLHTIKVPVVHAMRPSAVGAGPKGKGKRRARELESGVDESREGTRSTAVSNVTPTAVINDTRASISMTSLPHYPPPLPYTHPTPITPSSCFRICGLSLPYTSTTTNARSSPLSNVILLPQCPKSGPLVIFIKSNTSLS
ncbi:hypothetical protein NP233_g2794 [Leucocoprinus birnbaumii]|uniref:DNA 3'-5' helicase n=1 Tax=Leucocoprinus birnbaumii TaxID=56174 RepID=A0AAD5YWZ8_9AGAR|nr:hypothetical protein NP233_g2794 [Leucocoprinus birnbaumii]